MCAMRKSAPRQHGSCGSLILSRLGMSSTSCVALRHRTTRLAGRIAFKTGTSYGYRDAWAVGYDRQFTIGVWVGRPDGTAVPGLIGPPRGRADPVRCLWSDRSRTGTSADAALRAAGNHRNPAATLASHPQRCAEEHRVDDTGASQDRVPARWIARESRIVASG